MVRETGRGSTEVVPSASVAIVVYPFLYATALGELFRSRGYDVTAVDVMVEEWAPTAHYDVVVSSLPLERDGGHIHVELPDDYVNPVRISVAGISVEKLMGGPHPVEDLLDLIGQLVAEPVDLTADRLVALAGT